MKKSVCACFDRSVVNKQIFFFHCVGIKLSQEIQATCGPTLKEFKAKLVEDEGVKAKIAALKKEVEVFAVQFPLPGFDNW